MDKYSSFMSQIPENIIYNVEKHICTNVALFKPQTFIEGVNIYCTDYHIVIPPLNIPDAYVNDKLQRFKKGKVIAINPGDTWLCPHGYSTTEQYLSLLIKPELINRIAEEMGYSGNIRFLELQNSFSSELMQVIGSFNKETEDPDKITLMLDCLGIQIVTLLLREFKTNIIKHPAHLPERNIALAIEYMDAFFGSNITINDICNEINVSPFHFIRIFKQKTGFSPHQYLLRIRIKKAQELLRTRQYSVAEVAMLCGFIHISHFSSKFREFTGYSPSSYKKLYF